jgi:hypothetical protein
MKHRFLASLAACTGLALLSLGLSAGVCPTGQPGVLPPNSHPYGHSYAQWSALWWKWALELPVAGHPFLSDPVDLTEGQSGNVWFLASTFGASTRSGTIPSGKALFVGMLNAEASSLEPDPFHGDTAAEQATAANAVADLIVPSSLFFVIDGHPVTNLGAYRFQSPQFSFIAPNPWINSPAPSGAGTAVGDGYYVMLPPLSAGHHTLHYGGDFDFDGDGIPDASIDQTYNLTVGH